MRTTTSRIAQLKDHELIARTQELLGRERQITAHLVMHLAEMDRRRLYLKEGCTSLHAYCMEVLHLSEYAAYNRIAAARAGRKFPLVLEMLASGEIHLAGVGLLAPHLTHANYRSVLARARHRSKRQVQELVAELSPQPVVEARVCVVEAARPTPTEPVATAEPPTLAPTHRGGDNPEKPVQPTAPTASNPPLPTTTQPIAPDQFRVHFTANAESIQLLRRAQDLLQHQVPGGDLAEVFHLALAGLVETLERKKVGARKKVGTRNGVRPNQTPPSSRYIPAEVRRNVWSRDGARCAFSASTGRRCSATGHLEFHHVIPYARGGPATADNIELRCRAHNDYEAVVAYGKRWSPVVREAMPGYVRSAGNRQIAARAEPSAARRTLTRHGQNATTGAPNWPRGQLPAIRVGGCCQRTVSHPWHSQCVPGMTTGSAWGQCSARSARAATRPRIRSAALVPR